MEVLCDATHLAEYCWFFHFMSLEDKLQFLRKPQAFRSSIPDADWAGLRLPGSGRPPRPGQPGSPALGVPASASGP